MYNGYDARPPFRPPPMNLPPFPPNLGPGGQGPPAQGAPGPAYPPYPSPQIGGAGRPPFPPNLPSTPQYSPMGYNNGSPLPVRPMPGQGPGFAGSPMRPPHPGLGLPPLPSTLPVPPHRQTGTTGGGTNFIKPLKTTSVFVGSIAPGIEDATLIELLNACGPLHELKRVHGANNKPQAFGFALFESPEVVLRCTRCLNGVELPDTSPEGRRANKPPKALVVKVDEKTKEFLDEFEQEVGRTDDDEDADANARKLIAQIVARIVDPNAPMPDQPYRRSGGQSPISVIVPAHLQDLREGDLPENQRVAVLDQISLFRENAARKERAKKALEDQAELARLSQPAGFKKPPNPHEYGYGERVFAGATPYQAPAVRPDQPPAQRRGQGGQGRPDPQGYSRPVDFVKAQAPAAKAVSGRTDEEEEQLRQIKIAREKEGILRDRERQVEHRERLRLESLNRELTHRRQQTEMEERNRRNLADKLEYYDDDEVADKGKEWFFSDRHRWRNARQAQRTREYQEDVRDRQAEQDEIKALERESEEFLKRQMEEMARMEEEQKQRGLLSEDAAPVKLSLGATPAAAAAPVPAAKAKVEKPQPKPRPAIVNFEADDEEEGAADKRKQRTFVKLDYDENQVDKMTEAEEAAMRNAQLLDIRSQVSRDKRTLWGVSLDWKIINDRATKAKILGFVNSKLVEYLGEVDQDLADFIMENLAERNKPDEMVDGLEPVLAEEAVALVVQLWRLLAFETAAAKAGLTSGTMLV